MWSDANRTYVLLVRARSSELTPVVGYIHEHVH
jgi:hypothetical protein